MTASIIPFPSVCPPTGTPAIAAQKQNPAEAAAPTQPPAAATTAALPASYDVGAIVCSIYGYEQTNASFARIVARKGLWLTLQPLACVETSDGPLSMTGRAVPGEPTSAPTLRRRLRVDKVSGREIGFSMGSGWTHLWDGRPVSVSHYA